MEEIFKFYKETHPCNSKIRKNVYEVSNYGRIKCNGKIIKPHKYNEYLGLCGNYLHRIVAELFIPNPENKSQVDHIDGNKHNNCVNNLRWATARENSNNPVTCKTISVKLTGKNDWIMGRKWMNNGIRETLVKKEQIQEMCDNGWNIGRLINT